MIELSPERWRRIRAIVLARDNHTCVSCGLKPSVGELDIHHLVPRAAGGQDEIGNLITLCDGCHATRHPNLHASLARRFIVRWGLRLAHWLDRQNELESIDESLNAALRLLGAQRFRSPQLEVVLAAMRGESILLVSATGSGKSLCFQIPILLSHGTGVVISPLKALMSQQVEGLQRRQIPGTFINGDLSPNEKALRYRLLRAGAIKFLYLTPERFDPEMVREAEVDELSRSRPSYLVVDEAHCIDRWGDDFRPNYGRLGAVRHTLGSPPVLAFTATAGIESQKRILDSLGVPHARVIVTGVNRPNIALARLAEVKDEDRYLTIKRLLSAMPSGRAMIFVPTVAVGNQVRAGLRTVDCDVPFYYSQMGTANERDMLLGQFTGRLSPPANVVICTNAFGMGLDVPDVRLVVHWQHPASVEDYLQEFGRAGRDGAPSVAVLFTNPKDEGLQRFMAEKTSQASGNSAEDARLALEAKYHSIAQMRIRASDRKRCFRVMITSYFGEHSTKAKTSWAMRIVEWLFQRSVSIRPFSLCCDYCDRVAPSTVDQWAVRVWSESRKRA